MGQRDSRRSPSRVLLPNSRRVLPHRIYHDHLTEDSESHEYDHRLVVGEAVEGSNPIRRRDRWRGRGPSKPRRRLDSGTAKYDWNLEVELQGCFGSGGPVSAHDRAAVVNRSDLDAASDGASAAVFVLFSASLRKAAE